MVPVSDGAGPAKDADGADRARGADCTNSAGKSNNLGDTGLPPGPSGTSSNVVALSKEDIRCPIKPFVHHVFLCSLC